MLIRILLRLLVLAGAIWLTAWLLPNVTVTGGFFTYLWIALFWTAVLAAILIAIFSAALNLFVPDRRSR